MAPLPRSAFSGAAAALAILAGLASAGFVATSAGWTALPAADAAEGEIKLGAEAPDFTLKDQDGKDVQLSSFRGKKNVVIAFYPKAGTAGCTREMKCFTLEWKKIEDRGGQVLAVSGDAQAALKNFATALGTKFPLLSDSDFAVAKKWGVWVASPEGGFAARSAFLVDREGKLRWIQKDYAVPRTLDGNELLAALDAVKPATIDPADPLATLPSPEKEAKTTLVRYVQALLAEDIRAVDTMLHKEFGAKTGFTPAMVQQRRDSEMARVRRLCEEQDLKAVAFADAIDPRDGRVFAKGDAEKPAALAGVSEDAKKLVPDLPEGDLLLVARTKAPKIGEVQLLPREMHVFLRKDGETWKIYNLAGR